MKGFFRVSKAKIEGKRPKIDRFLKVSFQFVAIMQKIEYKIWTSSVIYSEI
jgi:hypothetical protein